MRKYILDILGLTFAIENAVLVLSCQPINRDDQT